MEAGMEKWFAVFKFKKKNSLRMYPLLLCIRYAGDSTLKIRDGISSINVTQAKLHPRSLGESSWSFTGDASVLSK